MAYADVVEKAINERIDVFTKILVEGDEFDSAIASMVVLVLKDLKKEVGIE